MERLEQKNALPENPWLPRKEYAEGKIPMHFETELSGGKQLVAKENEAGEVRIAIESGGQVIHDFRDDLAGGFKFLGPRATREIKIPPEDAGGIDFMPGYWFTGPKSYIVGIGDWRRPQEILALVHEIGHTHDAQALIDESIRLKQQLLSVTKQRRAAGDAHTKNSLGAQQQKLEKELWKIKSQRERGAWATGLRLLRRLRGQGIDVREWFESPNEILEYTHRALKGYKNHPALQFLADNDPEFAKEVEKLFLKE